MKALEDYLNDTFGVATAPQEEKEKQKKLPFYLRTNYALYSSLLIGQRIIWAVIKNPDIVTPDQLEKQGHALSEILGRVPVVYVFEYLEPWQRKRLIEKKVGFAEPFRQLYIPQLLTQIREDRRRQISKANATNQLTAPAQLLLLYHLQVQRLEGMLLQDIARLLNYSPMTITRSVKELSALALLRVEGSKEKSIAFDVQGKDLWEKSLPFLNNPVRETWYLDSKPQHEHIRVSGENALAGYTMIATPTQDTAAIGKDAFRLSQSQFGKLDKKYGFHKLEVWHYDPALLSNGKEVDRLSLYLSLKDQEDERVQGALEQMINEMRW